VNYGPNLARPNSQPARSRAKRPTLPQFRPSPMGRPAGLEPSWGIRQGKKSPSGMFTPAIVGARPILARRCPGEAGGGDSTETRWCGDSSLGLRGERGSPADALHGGDDSKMGASGGSSDQRSRRLAAGSESCLALPHSLGADSGWRRGSTVRCFLRRRQLLGCSRRCSPDALRMATMSGSHVHSPSTDSAWLLIDGCAAWRAKRQSRSMLEERRKRSNLWGRGGAVGKRMKW
jgi:hypothetical protein